MATRKTSVKKMPTKTVAKRSALIDAINSNESFTENGMPTFSSSNDFNVDLFFKFGARRGMEIKPEFSKAFNENKDYATRIALWGRDVREGAGERKLFRDILKYLIGKDVNRAEKVLMKIPELGRWDDLFVAFGTKLEGTALEMIAIALKNQNGLCAKWMPRKGPIANIIRRFLSLTPKEYRKLLVGATNVVEQKMCAKLFDEIEFDKIPSLAHSRYTKAFRRNAEVAYQKYLDSLVKGEKKINAGAVYPYDIIKSMRMARGRKESTTAVEQWKALPNYVSDTQRIIPVVDVSGSMGSLIGKNNNLSCLDISVSLGLYLSEKLEGPFKDTFITFSDNPKLQRLNGDLWDRYNQMNRAEWGMSTNLEAVFDLILNSAKKGKVSESEMPTMILIISDMEFNYCTRRPSAKAFEMIEKQYAEAGYKMPNIIFWNVQSRSSSNVPVEYNQEGYGLVSGFSPTIIRSVLAAKVITPEEIMRETILKERYDY